MNNFFEENNDIKTAEIKPWIEDILNKYGLEYVLINIPPPNRKYFEFYFELYMKFI